MDIEKPTQRKTVQWNTQEIKTNIIDHHQDFKKKVLEFETKKSQMHDEVIFVLLRVKIHAVMMIRLNTSHKRLLKWKKT